MKLVRAYQRDAAGAAAAEFALVLPIALLFFFGIIDVGRYVWTMNQLEKAVQIGTRYAVATDVVAVRLIEADYIHPSLTCPNAAGDEIELQPGATLCRDAQGLVKCSQEEGGITCECEMTSLGEKSCQGNDDDVNEAAFEKIVNRMRYVAPFISQGDVTVSYASSGIGYVGDPAGIDTAPIVTVEVKPSFGMRALTFMGMQMPLPTFSYSQTLEDGDGAVAY